MKDGKITVRQALQALVEGGILVFYQKEAIVDWGAIDEHEVFERILIEKGLSSDEYFLETNDMGHQIEFSLV